MLDENPIYKLYGNQSDNLDMLLELKTNDALKDLIEELRTKIFEYNNELVELIEKKDMLEEERENIVADIKDLSALL